MRRTASAWENPHCLCKRYFSHLKALSHSHSVWQKEGGMISSKLHLLLPPSTVHLKYWYVLLVISTCTRSGGGKGMQLLTIQHIFQVFVSAACAEWAIHLCSFPTYMSTFVFFPFPRTDQTSKCFASEFDWWISHSKPARMKTSTHLLYLTKSQILQRALGLKKHQSNSSCLGGVKCKQSADEIQTVVVIIVSRKIHLPPRRSMEHKRFVNVWYKVEKRP